MSDAGASPPSLGSPRLHLRRTESTNVRARELAARGAPHGTLVTADEQTWGRGRQGRTWSASAGRGLLCSLVIREPPRLLALAAGVAVAEVTGAAGARCSQPAAASRPQSGLKWPNDVLISGRKVAGILIEGRPQERWSVLGIGINVALREQDLPAGLRERAATLGLEPAAIEPTLTALLEALQRWLAAPAAPVLEAFRARDALLDRTVRWAGDGRADAGEGRGAGIDDDGRLLVDTADGRRLALGAGEVHLEAAQNER